MPIVMLKYGIALVGVKALEVKRPAGVNNVNVKKANQSALFFEFQNNTNKNKKKVWFTIKGIK